MYWNTLFNCFLLLSTYSRALINASPNEASRRALDCGNQQIKSLVSLVKAVASAEIDPFCSSYLHYTAQVTTTIITVTSTSTITSTVIKGTATVTTTVSEKGSKPKRTFHVEKRNTFPAPAETLSADAAGRVMGYGSDIVSGACSCLVSKPTKTSIITKTSNRVTTTVTTTTVKETKTVTVTTRKQEPSTTKGPATTTSKAVSTTPKSSSTGKPSTQSTTRTTTKTSSATTSTGSSTLTRCNSANPTFYVQYKDPGSRKDQYNNNYLRLGPESYRGAGYGGTWDVTASLSSATLLILELDTGHLRLADRAWYGTAEYFLNLTPIYFDPPDKIAQNGWDYTACSISAGILTCSVPYPSFRAIVQTCPEYVEYYVTPVALGDKEYTDGPVCYRKNMVVVPYCTPA